MRQKDAYDVKRVHRVNISVIVVLVFMICGLVVLSAGFKASLFPIIAGVVILGLCGCCRAG